MTRSPDEPVAEAPTTPLRAKAEAAPKELSPLQRLEIRVLGWLAAWVVRLIGTSLRWEIQGWDNWKAADARGQRIVYAFWHHEIFAATWLWRKRGIVVMSGYNFDARFTAQVIQKLGYEIARGSASRGAARALVGMVRAIQRGHDTAFTVDGPRGPRFVAKPGAVMLAKATGAAILCFHIRPARSWVFSKSWDRTEIPKPFTRIAAIIAPPILVPQDSDGAVQEGKLQEVQATLDELVKRGDEWRERSRNR